jgi:hypothetical protein
MRITIEVIPRGNDEYLLVKPNTVRTNQVQTEMRWVVTTPGRTIAEIKWNPNVQGPGTFFRVSDTEWGLNDVNPNKDGVRTLFPYTISINGKVSGQFVIGDPEVANDPTGGGGGGGQPVDVA